MRIYGFYKLFFVVLASCLSLKCLAINFIVADSDDHIPLGGTTIMMQNGTFIGITDNNGAFDCSSINLPITVRCMGYDELTLNALTDTVFLTPKSFELSEVVVSPVDRPILKLRCYIREYTTGAFDNDTIQMFGEYMADYFLTDKKVKGFGPNNQTPYIRVKRLRARYKNTDGLDSIAKPKEDDEFISWVSICSISPFRHTVPDSVLNGSTETVMGKYGEFSSYRANNNKLVYSRDILANHKDHHWSPWFFKMIGFTIDTSEMLAKDIFTIDKNGDYGPHTLQMATYTMEMTIKSKWVKKYFHTKDSIKTYSSIEVYPIESEYLTPQEAKDLKWDYSRTDITPSPLAPKLPPNILEMLNANISN